MVGAPVSKIGASGRNMTVSHTPSSAVERKRAARLDIARRLYQALLTQDPDRVITLCDSGGRMVAPHDPRPKQRDPEILMHNYRLFVYNENGQVIGAAQVISAGNDSEAIAQAEALRGSLAAELLDFDGLRMVKRLPPNGKAPSEPAE
jgi:hypothetical protein